MDSRFERYTKELESKFQSLIRMALVKIDFLPKVTPKGGVYIFSEGKNYLYVGRTKRTIKTRLKNHVNAGDDCPFAFRLAREKIGCTKATYTKKGSRQDLLSRPEFRKAYEEAKQRIKNMDIRYVEETNPIKQALLEIYVAVVLGAKYNKFETS